MLPQTKKSHKIKLNLSINTNKWFDFYIFTHFNAACNIAAANVFSTATKKGKGLDKIPRTQYIYIKINKMLFEL